MNTSCRHTPSRNINVLNKHNLVTNLFDNSSNKYIHLSLNTHLHNFLMHANVRNAIIAIIYFAVSGLVTAWFIEQKFGYLASPLTILFSNFVSVFKWAVIVIAAILLLGDNKWVFIRRVGFACFAGTGMLLTIFITRRFHIDSWQQFTYPVFLALFVMTILCYAAVHKTGLSIKWFVGWLVCVGIGIVLQTRVVLGLHPSLVTNAVSKIFVSPQKSKNS